MRIQLPLPQIPHVVILLKIRYSCPDIFETVTTRHLYVRGAMLAKEKCRYIFYMPIYWHA